MKTQSKKPGRIKAAVLNWLGVPVGLTDDAFWSSFGTTAAGQQGRIIDKHPVDHARQFQVRAHRVGWGQTTAR